MNASEALTPREIQIMRLIVDGFSNATIATHPGITRDTVKTHVNDRKATYFWINPEIGSGV